MKKSNKLSTSKNDIEILGLTIKELQIELDDLRTKNQKLKSGIMDRTKALELSKHAEKRFRAFFEQSNHASMVLNPNTPDGIPVIIEANKIALETHRYTREDFIGRPISDLDDQAGKRMVLERTQRMLNKEPLNIENIHVRKDGTTFPNEVYATRVDIEGEPTLIFTTEHDISKRKLLENKLRVSEEKLKQEVYVKDRFFSIIAHDLRSPFNSILGMTQLISQMANSYSKETLVELATTLNKEGERFFELLKNLLEWSRLQMEGTKQSQKSILLAELVNESMDILNSTALEKGISLISNIDKGVVFADQNMVRTVMLNLISNAIKFSRENEVVEVSARKTKSMVQVTVTDTGVGMSKDQVERVFSLDQETSTTGTSGENGTGLGLPLCKEMIERNKGEIWIESSIGEGSRIHFTLPISGGE